MKFNNKKQKLNTCLVGMIALLGVGTVQADVLERGTCTYLTKPIAAKGTTPALDGRQFTLVWEIIKEGTVGQPGAPKSDLHTTYEILPLTSEMFFRDNTSVSGITTFKLNVVSGNGWRFSRVIVNHDELAKNSVGDLFANIKNKETQQLIMNVPCFVSYSHIEDKVDPASVFKI